MGDSFDSLGALADHLTYAVVPNIGSTLRGGLHEVGEAVKVIAQSKFGTYQRGVYKYPRWAELAQATKEDRVKRGFSEDEPLLRTSHTRDSIDYGINGDDVIVGSSDPTMVYHEVGTKNEPPRPVLGPSLYEAKDLIRAIMGKATVLALVPGNNLTKALGFKRTGPRITSDRYDEYRKLLED